MKNLIKYICLLMLLAPTLVLGQSPPRTIHVFVALADNAHQGIAPVPAKIGNGDDPANNLYWGCDEGLKSYFKKSGQWKFVSSADPHTSAILERCIFKHTNSNTYLIADAYRGREIKTAIQDFMNAASGTNPEKIKIKINANEINLKIRGSSDLVAYIGHNGLMDFNIPDITNTRPVHKPAIVLCCMSRQYFEEKLKIAGASPLLLTTQLMYPGSFILKNALDGWLIGEPAPQIRQRAAQSYAKNQKISEKAALGVFAP